MRRIALLLLVLSSCTLIAPGKDAFLPLEPQNEAAIIRVDNPGVWFVKVRAFVPIPAETRRKAFAGKISYENLNVGFVNKQNVTWVRLEDASVPEGWELELVRQEASREVTSVSPSDLFGKEYEVQDSLQLIFRVSIPNQTTPGLTFIRTKLGVLTSSEKGLALWGILFKE